MPHLDALGSLQLAATLGTGDGGRSFAGGGDRAGGVLSRLEHLLVVAFATGGTPQQIVLS